MTRKDYKLIADSVLHARHLARTNENLARANGTGSVGAAINTCDRIAFELARSLEATNEHFDPARFLDACGYGDPAC